MTPPGSTALSSPVWHPFAQHALIPDFPLIEGAEGAWLTAQDGRRILDAISSWWVITHGHRHPKITAAIKDQADRLDQVIFANFTHQAAEDVALCLAALAGLPHVFFSDSGSTAVEVGLKMALGFWRHTGKPRQRIMALEHAYHGDTIGTMAAGARSVFNAAYEPFLFEVDRLPFPERGGQATLAALERCAPAAAALIVEPLLLGAGGMLTYAPEILAAMKRICEKHGTLFVADEVLTGFGRTGTMFACEQAGITPDILCLAKGLSGGTLPLAATLATSAIFDAHYSTDRARTFFHSSSFTANPIACAAARANLDIWKEEPVRARIATLSKAQKERLTSFGKDPRFAALRQIGTVAALDLKVPDPGYLAHLGPELMRYFLGQGVLLRPLGNTIYVMPPYCITAGELDLVYQAISRAAAKFV
ncbi:MAG TPA: adenosylmethionine--8-amino-7-oxononanoate transaminase [Rhizomicrobium sp.]|nr:adenosylmethionine--8-amino-7-oxononanoate transaminase [Rhizomicrobium sp.]